MTPLPVVPCPECVYWDTQSQDVDRGVCRRRAPNTHGFPVTFVTDRCGDGVRRPGPEPTNPSTPKHTSKGRKS